MPWMIGMPDESFNMNYVLNTGFFILHLGYWYLIFPIKL